MPNLLLTMWDTIKSSNIGILVAAGLGMFAIMGGLSMLSYHYTLSGIKSRTVGDGQHGTARWATDKEIRQTYAHVPFKVRDWRKGVSLPTEQGLVLGCKGKKDELTALVDSDDIHCLMIAASGAGKTAFFLYPNLEYACASGMSFLALDTKGDLARNYGSIAKKYYGYKHISVIDLRNPTRSDGNNLLTLINRYMDIARKQPDNLAARAKAEKYAKILAKSIVSPEGNSDHGQNAFFYDAAEGLLSSTILLLAEFLPPDEEHPEERRHIVSANEVVTVDSALYSAFELIRDNGSRYPYLAPVYTEYKGLFSCENDSEAEEFDPMLNSEVRGFVDETLTYVNNPDAIDIELLGENKLRLNVSDEYADFASKNGIEEYLDFFWLKNAFIVDYIAEHLAENSYIHGTITTYDGYTRHLGGAGMALSMNFYDEADGRGIPAAQMDFRTARNAVYFRNYENSDMDTMHFYTYSNGEVRNPFVDPKDGLCKASKSDLLMYSDELGCAEIALAAYGLYSSDSFDTEAVLSTAKRGVNALYCEGTEVCFTEAEATLSHLYQNDGLSYSAKHVS